MTMSMLSLSEHQILRPVSAVASHTVVVRVAVPPPTETDTWYGNGDYETGMKREETKWSSKKRWKEGDSESKRNRHGQNETQRQSAVETGL